MTPPDKYNLAYGMCKQGWWPVGGVCVALLCSEGGRAYSVAPSFFKSTVLAALRVLLNHTSCRCTRIDI